MNRRSAIVILAAVALAGLSAALAVLLTGGGDNEAAPAHTMPGGEAMTEPMADAAHEGVVEGTVWVANEGSGSLTAIDAATNKVVTTLTGVEGPHNLQVSPDGRSVWAVSGHDSLALMVDGVTFAEAWTGRLESTLLDVPVSFLGRDEFIRNKRACGRP